MLARRVAQQPQRAWLDEDPEAVLRQMALERGPLYAEVSHQVLDMDDRSPEEAARTIVAALG